MFKVGDKVRIVQSSHGETLQQFAALHREWKVMPEGIVSVVFPTDKYDPTDDSVYCEANWVGWWIPARYLELVVEQSNGIDKGEADNETL